MTETSQQIVLFTSHDGAVSIPATLERESVWLTQAQISELFGKERSVITKHIGNAIKEGEVEEESVCAVFAHTAADGKTYQVVCYNLEVIISVGYRVKSQRGVEFRRWANSVLRKYILQGYALNEPRLQALGQVFKVLRRAENL
ncbi:virulence RhuM family protein, partial [Myxococcota bacterium]|nr:virulence RhuM family protein [Myxococcota bacterium]